MTPRVVRAFRDRSEDLDQEYRILRPDGSIRWLRSRAFPVKHKDGDVRRVVGISVDITKRKQAEEKVNQNLNRIRALHDINLAITTTLDLPTVLKVLLAKIDNMFPYATVSTVRLLNRTNGELEALACHNIDLDDWKQSFVTERGGRAFEVLKNKVPLVVRNVLDHSHTVNRTLFQKYQLVSYIGLPLITKDEALGVLNLYTHVEHEFSSEEIEFLTTLAGQAAIAIHNAQLHEQSQLHLERIRAILETSLDCIITIDGEGKIIEFNPAAEKTFRYARSEAIGRELSELIIPRPLREKHRRGFAHYLATGEGPVLGKRIEIDAMRADGMEFPVELIISRTSMDGPPTFTGFIRDISERRRAEESQKAHYAELQTVYELSQKVLNTLDLEKILQEFLNNALSIGPFDIGVIRLLEPTEKSLRVATSKGYRDNNNIKHLTIGLNQVGIGVNLRQVIFERKTVISENIPESEGWGSFKREGVQSAIMFPIRTDERLLGIVHLGSRQRQKIRPSEASLLEALASQAGIAIQKAGLYEQTQRNLERIKALHEIDLAITSTLDLRQRLDVLLEKIDIFLPFPAASTIRLFNPATQKFENAACRNLDEQEWKPGTGRGTGRLSRQFLKTKSPVIIPNIQTDEERKTSEFFRKHGFVSYIGVPLIANDNIVGILGFFTREAHEFTQQEIDFLTTLAGQAAVAIDNATLYEQTERRRREAEELAQVARSLTETLDPMVVGERIVTSVRDLFAVQGATLRLRQADGSFRRLAFSGNVFSQTSSGEVVWQGVGLTSRAIAAGKPVWSSDILNDPEIVLTDEMRDYQILSGNRSMIVVPLRAHEKLIGTLTLSDCTGRTYSDDEVAVLQTFADQAALALENARLYEQTEHQLKRIEALREIEKSITSTLDLGTVLNVLMKNIDIFFTYPCAATVRLFDKESGLLKPAAARNVEIGEWIAAMHGVEHNERSYGKLIIEKAAPLIISNLQTDPRTQNPRFYRDHGLISYAGVPLIAKGEVLGVLGIYTKEERSFSNEEIELLMMLAGQAAIAIHNARLFEKNELAKREVEATNKFLDKSLNQLASLYTAMTPLAPSESLHEMMEGIIARLIDATGADAGLIRIWDKNTGGNPVIGQRGYSSEFVEALRPVRSEGAIHWVIEHGEPIIAPDIASEDRLRGKRQLTAGFQSCAILPLHVHDEVRGVIQISSRTRGYFDEEQKDHLLAVAQQMGIALENHELFYSLKASRDELERANGVKDEFLSVMSHELRTPLSVILGYTAMFQDRQLGPLTNEQKQAVDTVLRNSQELLEMIESIMDATKIEAGSMTAELDPVSPMQLLKEIKVVYEFPIAKNVRLEWQFPESLPLLWSDSRKLRQIITNLINNAIKFTEEGVIVIAAEEKRTADEKDAKPRIEFRVTDSGVGIPPEECDKIFDRFHQVDSSKTRRFEGVGLGLYIVKSFTEMLGGRVSVCSELGKGSTFTVSLPIQTP